MTAWVITIGEYFAENWRRAVEYQLWDLKRRRYIKKGDDIFFWQTPNVGFCGWVRATTDASDDLPLEPRPWIDDDKSVYIQRFYFELVADRLVPGNWQRFGSHLSIRAGLNSAPIALEAPADGAYLRSLYYDRIDRFWPTREIEYRALTDSFLSDEDTRRIAHTEAAVRDGQPAFRAELLRAYGSSCAVTGTDVVRVLQAAHISPYRGIHSNNVQNGLLLRSDVHALFDSKDLAVDRSYRIAIARDLRNSVYSDLHRAQVRLPEKHDQHPSPEALKQHWESCLWTGSW